MKLSIVILNYKVPYYLLLCLDSVKKATANISSEIIVVDNKSEDESSELVSKYFPEVIFIQNQENQGFSKGNNLGVAKAKGKYLCILNPDTVVEENCFSKLLNVYENTEKLGAVGTQLIDGSGKFLDTFIMSKGHGCMSQYVILEELKILTRKDLKLYCKPKGKLGAHPDFGIPGISASTRCFGGEC